MVYWVIAVLAVLAFGVPAAVSLANRHRREREMEDRLDAAVRNPAERPTGMPRSTGVPARIPDKATIKAERAGKRSEAAAAARAEEDRRRRREEEERRRDQDNDLMNPANPLSPLNPLTDPVGLYDGSPGPDFGGGSDFGGGGGGDFGGGGSSGDW